MNNCPKCGMVGGAWLTHACGIGLQTTFGAARDPLRTVEIDADVWTKIVFAAKESDDWKLRTLIEQAVMGPVPRA